MLAEKISHGVLNDIPSLRAGCIQELAKGTAILPLMQEDREGDATRGVISNGRPTGERVGLLGLQPDVSRWRGSEQRPLHGPVNNRGTASDGSGFCRTTALNAPDAPYGQGLLLLGVTD